MSNILDKLKEDDLYIPGVAEMQDLYKQKYAAKSQLKYIESMHNQGVTSESLTANQRKAIRDINSQLIEKLETGTTNHKWYLNKLKTQIKELREENAALIAERNGFIDDFNVIESVFERLEKDHPEVMADIVRPKGEKQ